MYILVQTCTYFLEIITVGVMYMFVQICTYFLGIKIVVQYVYVCTNLYGTNLYVDIKS